MESDWMDYRDYFGARFPGRARTRDAVDPVLFREFLERGGDIRTLARTIGFSDATIRLIGLLSEDEKHESPYLGNGPLLHAQGVLGREGDPEVRERLALIKIADRIGDLERRSRGDGVSLDYLKKSLDLLEWLFRECGGRPEESRSLRGRLGKVAIPGRRERQNRGSML